jgi:hypothetical protein
MEKQVLLKQLSALGFPLVEAEHSPNANLALPAVVKSKDPRLWEGFPVVLANAHQKELFDYQRLLNSLKTKSEKSQFNSLLVMSLALYRLCGLKFSWANKLLKVLPAGHKDDLDLFSNKLKNGEDFKVNNVVMSAQRLKNTFNNYYNQSQSALGDLLARKQEFGLEYALSQVFSPKQKELFLKKLKGEKLTKTEREYFSRTVKKKVLALANSDLHQLARKILE